MYISHKSCFGFEIVEEIKPNKLIFDWQEINMERRLGLFVLQKSALENNFMFTDNFNSDTVIIEYFKNYYCGEILEFHLTTVKDFDYFGNDVLKNIHLTLRNNSSKPKCCSFYYELQHSKMKNFRFCRTDELFNNQTDEMSEFLGQQGIYNFSSAVLQPILKILYELNEASKLQLSKRCLSKKVY